MDLRLTHLTADTLPQALAIPPAVGERAYVAPVMQSLAEAYVTPTAWVRLVEDAQRAEGNRVVAFVMANWDPENEVEEFRAGIWRLNVIEEAKSQGVGRFAVAQIVAEARRRGIDRITVLWEPAPDGPEGFYLRLGFRPVGELFGEVVGELDVPVDGVLRP